MVGQREVFLSRHRLVATLMLVVVALALAVWADAPADIDDAAITYRYAENLAAGMGFVYNEGDPVWGTTTPLYTLLLVPFVFMGVPVGLAGYLLGLAGAALTAYFSANLAEHITGTRSGFWIAGLWSAVAAPLSVWAVSGMETLPYIALLLGTWSALIRCHDGIAAGLAGLAWLMRPDGLIVLIALLLVLVIRNKRLPWRELGIWVLVVAPWTIFSLWQFHAVLPRTLAAKQAHVLVADPLWFLLYLAEPQWWPALAVGMVGLLLLLRNPLRGEATLLGMALWLMGYVAAYTLVKIDYYEWYCIPIIPFLGIFAACGACRLANAVTKSRRWKQVFIGIIAVSFLSPIGIVRARYIDQHRNYLSSVELTRIVAGRWLQANTVPNAIVAAGAIGHLGLESRRTILDLAGLVSEASGPYDYIVGGDGYPLPGDRFGVDPDFLRWHRLVASFTPSSPHERQVHKIFQRLTEPSLLPEQMLFRNGYLDHPEDLRPPRPLLNFASKEDWRFLSVGWAAPERNWGTWATATQAAVDLVLEAGQDYEVEMTLAPFERPGYAQHLTVEHNGHEVLAETSLVPGFQVIRFVLKQTAIDGRVDRLNFRLSYAVSPQELGQSQDTRPLSIVLSSLRIEPVGGE